MITSNDKEYIESKLIKQGKSKIKKEFVQFLNWIHKTYGVKPLNVTYEIIDTNRPRIMIILELEQEKNMFLVDRFFEDKEKEKNILSWLKINFDPNFNLENLFIVFNDFESIAIQEATSKISEIEVEKLKEELDIKDLWKIYTLFSTPVFFFYNDKQIEEYSKKGIEEYLTSCYVDLLKKYDEFDYAKKESFKIKLDSKENFDKNYVGSWFGYTR